MENLTYLTALLPPGENFAFGLAKRLNAKRIKPVRKESYSEDRIKNVIYGKTKDENVKPELISWLREIYAEDVLKAKIEAYRQRANLMVAELLDEPKPPIEFFTHDDNRPIYKRKKKVAFEEPPIAL